MPAKYTRQLDRQGIQARSWGVEAIATPVKWAFLVYRVQTKKDSGQMDLV